jgi:crotonobetainyl-CoA:carnitine CoA-transferase CaiB-like acyl-CoA transferase
MVCKAGLAKPPGGETRTARLPRIGFSCCKRFHGAISDVGERAMRAVCRGFIMELPLGGVSILDIGTLTPGKFCTTILADMGASVLRVERPGAGRALSDEDLVLNRSKKSMTLDLRADAGRDILCRLAERNDVVIESYRPGVTRRLGIDYDALKRRNSRLVYCSLSGFGQDGPAANRPAYDLLFVAASGLLNAIAGADRPPFVPGAYLSDAVAGVMAAVAICSAMVRQRSTGEGCHVDLAMLDSVFSLLAVSHGVRRAGAAQGEETDAAASPFYNVYQAADGRYLALAAIRSESRKTLCRELGRPELGEREPANAQESADVFAFLGRAFKQDSAAAWISRLVALDIEIAPVNRPRDAFEDPQLVARGMVVNDSHPRVPDGFQRIGNPIRSSLEARLAVSAPAPVPGQDTEEVLRGLGYAQGEIEPLRKDGVI